MTETKGCKIAGPALPGGWMWHEELSREARAVGLAAAWIGRASWEPFRC
ncbi:hypothetical protein ruthe_01144 [Rubellimicrobium thermophilum DSM 16684]|uniref:Uncharacterized protein n=1 Tax=Rubellimicrobium thermophilum DSM 16684 TaxID=1123069 RepID=S9SIY2_9RHOB|nr:hypothetical protein ruthe_01144 [Rubellimicrobium thermophilum DSM 16684]